MTKKWTVKQSCDLYNIDNWSKGYFSVNRNGNISVFSKSGSKKSVDLKKIIDELIQRKIKPPILLRFMNILNDRITNINNSFNDAIEEYDYKGKYQLFYPLKVNQQRQVVESITKYGKKFNVGLEAGSKPELIAALSVMSNSKNEIPILCNGYKDEDFLETVLYAHKIGYKITVIIEKMFELKKIINLIEQHKIKPKLGIRIKLTARGIGKWASSGGKHSKFGLKISELMTALDLLKKNKLLNNLVLVHFHIGSQITKIDKIKNAINEAGRIYVQLKKYGAEKLKYIDVGGGLGVDYDGSKSSYFSSVNYTLTEYASDIIYQIKNICDENNLEHPNIISESGRALVAHYSVLVTNILDSQTKIESMTESDLEKIVNDKKCMPTIKKLYDIYISIDKHSLREDYHDTIQLYNEAVSLFNLGYASLEQRTITEKLCEIIFEKIRRILSKLRNIPEELKKFENSVKKNYFANFSLFQSIPDSWAVDQIFPIVPIQRLKEKPDEIAAIADITCDSDGIIELFVGDKGKKKNYLPVHKIISDENYYIGIFLIGAYQEILGDMHNLFGDTNAVHINMNNNSNYKIETVIVGDTIAESLKYVQYDFRQILKKMREKLEKKVSSKKITIEDSINFLELYKRILEEYTYLM